MDFFSQCFDDSSWEKKRRKWSDSWCNPCMSSVVEGLLGFRHKKQLGYFMFWVKIPTAVTVSGFLSAWLINSCLLIIHPSSYLFYPTSNSHIIKTNRVTTGNIHIYMLCYVIAPGKRKKKDSLWLQQYLKSKDCKWKEAMVELTGIRKRAEASCSTFCCFI